MRWTRRSALGAAVLIACGAALIVADIPFWARLIGYGAAGLAVALFIFKVRTPRALLLLAALMPLAAVFGAGLGWALTAMPGWMLYVLATAIVAFELTRWRRRRRPGPS